MHKEFLMGNEAMALGAIAAGVGVVAGYPGTKKPGLKWRQARHTAESVHW